MERWQSFAGQQIKTARAAIKTLQEFQCPPIRGWEDGARGAADPAGLGRAGAPG